MTDILDFLSSYAWSGAAMLDNGIVGGAPPVLVAIAALVGAVVCTIVLMGIVAQAVNRWTR